MKQIVFVVSLAALPLLAAENLNEVVDLKPLAMQFYGVRKAWAEDETTVKVIVGPSLTSARGTASSYLVQSEEDPDYAYEKFVTAKAAKSKPDKVQFKYPEGFSVPSRASIDLKRAEVTLTLPFPLKPGKRYGLVARGEGQTMVTAGKTGTYFTFGPDPSGGERFWDGEALAARMAGLRRASSVGDGKILCEFGPGYSPPGGCRLANWTVTVNGRARKVLALGRRSTIECMWPNGWPYRGFLRHDIFLDLGEELKDGDRVEVVVGEKIAVGERAAAFVFDSAKSISRSVKVNQVGYLPDGLKVAYLGCWMGSMPDKGAVSAEVKKEEATSFTVDDFYAEAGKGDQDARERKAAEAAKAEAEQPVAAAGDGYEGLAPYALRFKTVPKFTIREEKSGKVVFGGEVKLAHNGLKDDYKGNLSAENVYTLDFTAFAKPGRYFISVPGVGRSLAFEIGDKVYAKAFQVQAQGLYEQRCGCKLDPKLTGGWHRIACHAKGVVSTHLPRWTDGYFWKFEKNMDKVDDPRFPPFRAKQEKLERDPALRAWFKFDGSLDNAVKGSDVRLTPLGEGGEFVPDKDLGRKVYRTTDAAVNGLEANYKINPSNGVTAVFRMRRNDNEAGGQWGHKLLSFGTSNDDGFSIRVNWGSILGWGRVNDDRWRIYVLRCGAADEKGRMPYDFLINGEKANGENATAGLPKVDVVRFAWLDGDGVAGCHFYDFRLYDRPLTDAEIADLCSKVEERMPLVLDARGGHHDAGDYNPRAHIDVAQALFNAYELKPKLFRDGQLPIPEAGNGIPDIIDEGLWAVRIWEGLQDADGGVHNGTEADGDPNFIQTVDIDPKGDFAFGKDAKGSFYAAGVFAQAARLLKATGGRKSASGLGADDYLRRAKRAYAWGVKHPPEGLKSASSYGEYFYAARAYAASELYHTTGEKEYHEDFKAFSPWTKVREAECYNEGKFDVSLAAYSYVLIPRETADPELWDAVLDSIRRKADMYIRGSDQMAYKFVRHPYAPLTWGTGAYQNFTVPLAFVWAKTGEEKYREWMIRSCDNTLGANPLGLSWITGLGERTVRCPLHNSRYRPEGFPVDGLQEQGPNQTASGYSYEETAYPWHRNSFAALQEHSDVHFCIAMDEPTVNNMVNTALVFGLLMK